MTNRPFPSRQRPALVAIVMAALLSSATGGRSSPAIATAAGADDDAIVFAGAAGGGSPDDLFAILPDGSGRRSLTAGPGVPADDIIERLPDWSPDGDEVAFVAPRTDGPAPAARAIWLLTRDAAGAPIRVPLTYGPYDTDPDWSPDGTRIAYVSVLDRDGPTPIHALSVVNARSGDQQLVLSPLAVPNVGIEQPRWSPDGRRIVFVVRAYAGAGTNAPPLNEGGDLYVVNSDGTGARRLLARPGWDDFYPAWSPDGRLIAFNSFDVPAAGSDQVKGAGIWLLDPATGQLGLLAGGDREAWPVYPKWSPDGRRIVAEGPWRGDVPTLLTFERDTPNVRTPLTLGREPDWARRPLVPTPTPVPTGHGPTPTEGPSPAVTATQPPEPATPTPPPIPGLTPFPTLAPFPTLPPLEPTLPPVAPTWPVPSATFTPAPTATPTPSPTATPTASATPTRTPGGRIYLPLSLAAAPVAEPR